jgi:hypothetical protein
MNDNFVTHLFLYVIRSTFRCRQFGCASCFWCPAWLKLRTQMNGTTGNHSSIAPSSFVHTIALTTVAVIMKQPCVLATQTGLVLGVSIVCLPLMDSQYSHVQGISTLDANSTITSPPVPSYSWQYYKLNIVGSPIITVVVSVFSVSSTNPKDKLQQHRQR